MADYDPLDPPTYDGDAEDEGDDEQQQQAYDPAEYQGGAEDGNGEGDDDDYDPSSMQYGDDSDTTAAAQPKQPLTQAEPAPKVLQKVAGFIVEESDDEQDASAQLSPSQLNGTTGAHSGLGAIAVSEAQDVSLSSAPQDTAASASTSLNGFSTIPVLETSSSTTFPDPSAPEKGKNVSPVASAQEFASTPAPAASTPVAATQAQQAPQNLPQLNGTIQQQPLARLPHDKVGQLRDRISADPKGDPDAYMALIHHYVDKGQYDYARGVYRELLKVFPTGVLAWVRYIQMEKSLDENNNVVHILTECLPTIANVDLWKFYMDHVRRTLPLINDTTGSNRAELMNAWNSTFENVGIDPAAGGLWREYIEFMKDGPGRVGGTGWQDAQKADLLRAAYQRAIKIPNDEFTSIWKEYEAFERSVNPQAARKHIQEQSNHYMEARKAKIQLDQKLHGLDRTSLPRMPPIYGFDGEEQFGDQVEKWRAWIAWEKDEDPLVFKGAEDDKWRQRVLYAYGQATMFLAFYPEIWFEAASWCFTQPQLAEAGEQFLDKGIAANPESVLLAMLKVDRVEASLATGNTDEVLIANGDKLDKPFEAIHKALYDLATKTKQNKAASMQKIQQHFASLPSEDQEMQDQEDDEDEEMPKPKTRQEQMQAQIDAAKSSFDAQLDTLKRTISYVWVAKMRAFRRVQGQGKPLKKAAESGGVKEVRGLRGIFTEARPRGMLSSDVYIASALLDWHGYQDKTAIKIFERGLKLFPEDHIFILEYIKHLINVQDITNARVVFETAITKLNNAAKYSLDQRRDKCRPLFVFMHDHESKYGDYAQIRKLETRMAELYPEEPEISRFSHRFELPEFDAIGVQLLLSPSQARPKANNTQVLAPQQDPPASIETRPQAGEILLGPNGPYVASPKRPLEDFDVDTPQRKFMRGESPLKGVRGSKGSATVPLGNVTSGGGFATKTFVPAGAPPVMAGPPPLPPQVEAMLRVLPPPSAYNATRFDPVKLVQYIPRVALEKAKV